jgi:hypothetical protein
MQARSTLKGLTMKMQATLIKIGSVLLLSSALLLCGTLHSVAQTQKGSVHGSVTDPTGAVIPSSTVTVTSSEGASQTAISGGDGFYTVGNLEPGRDTITATADGFAKPDAVEIDVFAGKATLKNIALPLPVEQQQVTVSEDTLGVDTSADNNASAMVIKGKDLDALSDDPDELQDELTALAGPAAGPNGGQIYIDGFTGGQLPPKSSIREIRINQNPFSAQYDKLGYGRIEILTKPGTDKLHGMFMINGNDSAFNSLNPFVSSEPPYYSTFMMGNAGGALSKTSSWFGSVFDRNNQSNSIINAVEYDRTTAQQSNYSAAVANPQSRLDVSPRLDFQLGKNNTLTVRYMFDRQIETNSGVSQFALESQAYNVANYENTIQLSDTQVISPNVINETNFQFMRDGDSQTPQSTAPTVSVAGSFTGGGNSTGIDRDTQEHYELQNYTMITKGNHSINTGARLRFQSDANYANSGFNGVFTYACLTSSATCSNSYASGNPSEYDISTGNPAVHVNYWDLGLYYQDDMKLKPNLTFSYGIRYESQNDIADHNDWAPRLSFAWAPAGKGTTQARTVIRGGYGWFFDRFQETNILQAYRNNGANVQQYVVKDPAFNETNAPSASSLAALSTSAPTIYQIAPNMRSGINMQAALGVEHLFGKVATVAVTYINSHGLHEPYTDNINAFEPSTYDAATGAGVRPNGINENIYQFQSGGVYNQNQLMVNYTVKAKRATLFGFYVLNSAKADTSGAGYFPSNQSNPGADYGRANFDVRNRFLLGGNIQAPYGVSFSPMLVVDSGTPFNITIGQDLLGDNQYNQRPALATSASTDTVATSYGTFDLDPAWNAARIPYNMGNGPGQLSMNLRVSRSFGIGPRVTGGSATGGQGGPGGPGGPGGGGGPRGGGGPGGPGGMGGGLGPGGLSGSNGGPPGMNPQSVPRKYALNFSAMGRNVFNNVNLAAPVGVLDSSLFGKSNALSGGFFGSGASNRSLDLQVSFSF